MSFAQPGNDSDPGQSNGYTLGFEETRIDSMSAGPGLKESITTGATALGMTLTEAEAESMAVLVNALSHWNRRINLTAIRNTSAMVAGHILDSLVAACHLRGARVLDLGTGAGFPGLPLAIMEPEREFVLLDSNRKKISFVGHMIAELGLDNAKVAKARAEDYAPGKRFDTVIARALASLPRLAELSAHLVEESGQLLALKGKYPVEELEAIRLLSEWEYSVKSVDVPGLDAERHIVRLKRIEARS